MARQNFNDLQAFLSVAREGSFTRAAAKLNISQSALSQTIAALEERLKTQLLRRTTRSLSLTAAGERLFAAIAAPFDEIENGLQSLNAMREKPAGTVRISCGSSVIKQILLPKLAPLLRCSPDIKLELNVNYGFVDIVAEKFDAGIRFGETIDKDMIALPIAAETRMAAAAAPAYWQARPRPQTPRDLTAHNCINMRFPTHGGLYVWEFERGAKTLNIRVDGQLTVNTTEAMTEAALMGLGIGFLPQEEFASYLKDGRLIRVLEDWCPPFSGYHIYYPSRRRHTPAFAAVLKALREKITPA